MTGAKLRILFVCGGNTCRSPMAASLAAKALGDAADVTSAGVAACGQAASKRTVALMRSKYGIDLSQHRSTDIKGLLLNEFDYIIAMKPDYSKTIVREFGIPSSKVVRWDVDDPFDDNTNAAYERCLARIEKLLCLLLKQIRTRRPRVETMTLSKRVSELRANLTRWRGEISSGKARGTHLAGIAGKAVNCFEGVFRESLQSCLDSCHVPYDSRLAPQFKGKPFKKLTLGELITAFGEVDSDLTMGLQSTSLTAGRMLTNRSLIDCPHKKRLKVIKKLRNLFAHDIEVFAKDESTLIKNSQHLIDEIQQELAEPLFQIVQDGSSFNSA